MPSRIQFGVDEFYHVYARGTERREIFLNATDYGRFQKLLYLCNGINKFVFRETKDVDTYTAEVGEPLVAIGAYCLMPNHFHLLLKEISPGGISRFMAKLLTSYSMFFNKKYKRTGRLFEGAFRVRHIESDPYFQYIYSYIHLNPVKLILPNWKNTNLNDYKDSMLKYLKTYSFSSFNDYVSEDSSRIEKAILRKDFFPKYFSEKTDSIKELEYWLKYKHEQLLDR